MPFKGKTISFTINNNIEIGKIITQYVKDSEVVQKRYNNENVFEIKSKKRTQFLIPRLPNFNIVIKILKVGESRRIISKIRGNTLIDFFLTLGSLASIFIISFLIINKGLSLAILNIVGLFMGLLVLFQINNSYIKAGEIECRRIEKKLCTAAGTPLAPRLEE